MNATSAQYPHGTNEFAMASIGLHELPEMLRTILEQGETLDVIDQGAIVARIVPVTSAQGELDASLYQRVRERVADPEHLPPSTH